MGDDHTYYNLKPRASSPSLLQGYLQDDVVFIPPTPKTLVKSQPLEDDEVINLDDSDSDDQSIKSEPIFIIKEENEEDDDEDEIEFLGSRQCDIKIKVTSSKEKSTKESVPQTNRVPCTLTSQAPAPVISNKVALEKPTTSKQPAPPILNLNNQGPQVSFLVQPPEIPTQINSQSNTSENVLPTFAIPHPISGISVPSETAATAIIFQFSGGVTQRYVHETESHKDKQLVIGSCQTGESIVNGETEIRNSVDLTSSSTPSQRNETGVQTSKVHISSSSLKRRHESADNGQGETSRKEKSINTDKSKPKDKHDEYLIDNQCRQEIRAPAKSAVIPRFKTPSQLIDLINQRCKKCEHKDKFDRRSDSVNHHKKEHNTKFCPVCFNRFSRKGNDLKDHFIKFHVTNKNFEMAPCPFCKKDFNFEGMYQHICKVHLVPIENNIEKEKARLRSRDLPTKSPQQFSGSGPSSRPPPIFYSPTHDDDKETEENDSRGEIQEKSPNTRVSTSKKPSSHSNHPLQKSSKGPGVFRSIPSSSSSISKSEQNKGIIRDEQQRVSNKTYSRENQSDMIRPKRRTGNTSLYAKTTTTSVHTNEGLYSCSDTILNEFQTIQLERYCKLHGYPKDEKNMEILAKLIKVNLSLVQKWVRRKIGRK